MTRIEVIPLVKPGQVVSSDNDQEISEIKPFCINSIYEFGCGELSGWMDWVNVGNYYEVGG